MRTRILTALVLIPGTIAALFFVPPPECAAITLAIVALASSEWALLAGYHKPSGLLLVAGTVLIGACMLLTRWSGFDADGGWPEPLVASICGAATLFWVVIAPAWLYFGWRVESKIVLTLVGWLALIATWVAVVQLQARSPALLLALMAIVWVADSAAYFAGRRFGKRKLAPAISPGKTWEGVYGALIAVAVYALALLPFAEGVGYSAVIVPASVIALIALVERFRPPVAAMRDPDAAQQLEGELRRRSLPTRVLCGVEGLRDVAALPEVDTVIAAIVGAAGLESTLAAAKTGKRVLLANKETLVLAGALFMSAVRDSGAILLPIDSEHNAIFQCLPQDRTPSTPACGVRRVLLTASGGPFRVTPLPELQSVSPEQACAHPKWRMGRKISVDSATMMNKGLEIIEAHWLVGIARGAIEVVIHPESIVHSLVEYLDGSVLAQLGNPDMRTPIAQALAWPERISSGVAPLELARIGSLNFFAPDLARFPCLGVAYEALGAGGTAPAILNAANEVAVGGLPPRQKRFLHIPPALANTHRPAAAAPPAL